jgi:GTP-binding protein
MLTENELKQRFKRAHFIGSSPTLNNVPPDVGYEVAFAGRSNAGKSSAINALTDQHELARVSKTPGRTQHLVFFDMSQERRLVDLPGYGYAKVPDAIRMAWRQVIDQYLRERVSLQGLVLLMDIRHPMTDFDQQMLAWTHARALPTLVLLTKSDKLNRGPALDVFRKVKRVLADAFPNAEIELFSSETKAGVGNARWKIAQWCRWAEPLSSVREQESSASSGAS